MTDSPAAVDAYIAGFPTEIADRLPQEKMRRLTAAIVVSRSGR